LSEISPEGAHFSELCARAASLIFRQNITGIHVGRKYEAVASPRTGQMVTSIAARKWPKLTLIIGGVRRVQLLLCGRAYGPRFLWNVAHAPHHR